MNQTIEFKFAVNELIYSATQGVAFVIVDTPDNYSVDSIPCYKLKRNTPPHWEESYSVKFVETNFTNVPPHPIQKNVDVDNSKFNIRDVVRTNNTDHFSIIVDKPKVPYQGRMIPGYKLVPAFNPGGHEEFTMPQVTAETMMQKVDNPEKYIPVLEDFAAYLIRGDILQTRLFSELKRQLYVIKVEGAGSDLRIFGRIMTKGVASNEITSYTKRELANLYYLESLQTYNVPVTNIKYKLDDVIKHVKSGEEYRIVMTPDKGVLENTREPAYSFEMPDGRVCHRAQKEVEESDRFVLYSRAIGPVINFHVNVNGQDVEAAPTESNQPGSFTPAL
jgi:hypothetical protein